MATSKNSQKIHEEPFGMDASWSFTMNPCPKFLKSFEDRLCSENEIEQNRSELIETSAANVRTARQRAKSETNELTSEEEDRLREGLNTEHS
ncbi:MAG: hypothetical protein WB679_26810 [Terracidiphilus sp.]